MAVRIHQTIFQYKTKKGLYHKIPAVIKLVLLLPLSIFCVSFPSGWLLTGTLTVIIIALIGGITPKEQLCDLKPVFIYGVFMYLLSVFSNLFEYPVITRSFPDLYTIFIILKPNADYLHLALRLTLIVQLSALLFRTTSSLEIRGLLRIESISVFLMFIPEIFKIWTSINLAWKARGGKNGLVKIKTLLFVLISLCFEKAAIKSKALEARR
jgi:energy-coupling factor transporter transmembrane protein EcfT